nr:Daxx protein [Hymenolepis microstoma]
MDGVWDEFIKQLDELLLGDNQVITKLTKMYHSTSYRFQKDSNTARLLQDFIKRIGSSPLDAYPILLELKLIFSKNVRHATERLPKTRSRRYKFRQTISTENSSGTSHDEPPKHRRVKFINLNDSPRSEEIDREDEEENVREVVSRVRKRLHCVKSANSVAHPSKNRKLAAKVQQTDFEKFYKLRNLERTMLHISHKIQQLEETEVDFSDEENSEYLRIDALKRQELKLWKEYCRLKGSNPQVARLDRQTFQYNGSRFPEINQAVENLVKSSHNMPDYPDVRNLVVDLYPTLSPHSSSKAIDKEARRIFVEVCQKLKNRREMEFQRDIYHPSGVDQPDADADPALHSPDLRKQLRANERLADSNLQSVIIKYSRLQEILEREEATDSNESANEDLPSPIVQSTSDDYEAEEPVPISTEDAQISCPVFEEGESSGEISPPEMPRSGADSSNSPQEMIVISDGEEDDIIECNVNVDDGDGDDDDDEPEIVGVEYHAPPPRKQPSHSGSVPLFSFPQRTIQHTTVNNRKFALPLRNGSTVFVAMAEQRVVQLIPRSS